MRTFALSLGLFAILTVAGASGQPLVTWTTGAGWALHAVHAVTGFDVRIDLDAAGQAVVGVRVYDSAWQLVGAPTGYRADSGAWVSISSESGSDPMNARVIPAGHGGGIASARVVGGGDFHVLTFVVGDTVGATGTISTSDSGAAVVQTAGGEDTFFETGQTTPADVGVRAHAATARAVAEAGARVELSVTRGFVGVIGTTSDVVGDEIVTLQWAGGERLCPCLFNAWPGLDGLGPGQYTVTRTAAKIEPAFARPLIAGIDVG